MKTILGLDLGTNSIGWAVVHEAEDEAEQSSIEKLGVRIVPLSNDEVQYFEKQKGETLNAMRTLKRGMRRNLQRYKLRREALIELLKEHHIISSDTILSEQGNYSTFETYRLRAAAVTEEVSLEEFARVLLMINKKRGYKSNRKANKSAASEDGALINGMEIARKLYEDGLTPAEYVYPLLKSGTNFIPDFYRSDLCDEFNRIWNFQRQYYPAQLTEQARTEVIGKNKGQTWSILSKYFVTEETNSDGEIVTRTLTGVKRSLKGRDLKLENYAWRVRALRHQMSLEELVYVFQEINGEINSSSGYLGAISDRSKELFFNHQTVGQYLLSLIQTSPTASLKNKVFYRQDYLDEFEILWTSQSQYHPELTSELKKEIRDAIIFYQRRLKSKKNLVAYCEFEQQQKTVTVNGNNKTITVGSRVVPKSSPLFQEFKIWQILNNLRVSRTSAKPKKRAASNLQLTLDDSDWNERELNQSEKELLAVELSVKDKLTKSSVLKLLFGKTAGLDLNFKTIEGNVTGNRLYKAFSTLIEYSGHTPIDFNQPAEEIIAYAHTIFTALGWNDAVLTFDSSQPLDAQPYYRLWHLLYSYEDDNSATGDQALLTKLAALCQIDLAYASALSNVTFPDDYGSLSAKAIRKILPFMKEGTPYDVACLYAGYRHSKSSLTREELDAKELKDHLDLLPRNSLRNPIVEKILNQMIHVVNAVIATYGRPDEIRVEMARDLKKSAQERIEMSTDIATATRANEEIRKLLSDPNGPFKLAHVSRKDVILYRLYQELALNGYKTLYSNQYIPAEKLFTGEITVEHIVPRALLFDDSYSNKTLEYNDVNIEKGKQTAFDYVFRKYGDEGLVQYRNVCEKCFKATSTKYKKLMMTMADIPDGFIERDLRNTQYIAKKALAMLHDVSRRVVATTGSITDRLRDDWGLVDVLKELDWDKYSALGLTETYRTSDGHEVRKIQDWTKRNDQRHHAMDALTVAFTRDAFIQYFNHMNASDNPSSDIYGIKRKYVRDTKIIAPMPLAQFRAEAKQHLNDVLISFKRKNKAVTTRKVRATDGTQHTLFTPRGALHEETIYGRRFEYRTTEVKVNASMDERVIATVCKQRYRELLFARLHANGNDSKKAFSGRNSLDKNPIWLDAAQTQPLPAKVKVVTLDPYFTIRKPITKDLKIDKVVDKQARVLLQARLNAYHGNAQNAFSNLDENPIWLNESRGIALKRVTIQAKADGCIPLHALKDKDGHYVLDAHGGRIPTDYVNSGANHHIAIYRRAVVAKDGSMKYELNEVVVPFFEAVARALNGYPVIDKNFKANEGWEFMFTLQQNDYFVFPSEGFNPHETDLLNPANLAEVSPHLFRVQSLSSKYYCFRHHLDTTTDDAECLREVTWKRIRNLQALTTIVKVHVDHLGRIVRIGE